MLSALGDLDLMAGQAIATIAVMRATHAVVPLQHVSAAVSRCLRARRRRVGVTSTTLGTGGPSLSVPLSPMVKLSAAAKMVPPVSELSFPPRRSIANQGLIISRLL